MKKLFIATAIFLGVSFSANSQTASSSAAATILEAMTLNNNTELDFGALSVPSTASVVVMSAAGVRSISSGDVTFIAHNTGTQATFTVTAAGSTSYILTLPSTDVTITNTSTAQEMEVSAFNFISTDASDTSSPVAMPAAGSDTFNVGASLAMGTDEAIGLYTGTYDVTVAYE